MPHGTAYEGVFYKKRLKTRASKAAFPVPDQMRPFIEARKALCTDSSPGPLMFPTFGRGERTGQAVPPDGKNFLRWRIRPVSRKLGLPDRLVTFQVNAPHHGNRYAEPWTLKDTQSALRHASITTTGNVYVQTLDANVARAVNSRATAALDGWSPAEKLGLKGRNIRKALKTPEQGQMAI